MRVAASDCPVKVISTDEIYRGMLLREFAASR